MRIQFQKSLRIAAVLALLGTAGAAQAHTGHGTSTLFEGLAHPFGPDHLLAMLAVGLWSVASLPAGKVWRGPVTFMLSLVAGATLGLLGVTVPMLEQLIALSVVLFGALLIITPFKIATTATSAGLWLVAGAAMLHGLAHGAEAPAGNFAAYAMGFLLTTAMLHAMGVVAATGLRRYLARQSNWLLAAIGTLTSGAGLVLVASV